MFFVSDFKFCLLGVDYIDEYLLLVRSGGEGEVGGEFGKLVNDLCGEMEEIVFFFDFLGFLDLYLLRLFMMW